MKRMLSIVTAFAAVSASNFPSASASAAVVESARCGLNSVSPNAPEWQNQEFPLIKTFDGYEAATSMGSSEIFELESIAPADLAGWPNYGGSYYKGGNDVWVIVTPAQESLPAGAAFKVIKPSETDPNTSARPAVYICYRSM